MTRLGAVGLALTLAAGRAAAGPADPPPADFAGPTWVDSRGCAFQRAEIGGSTTNRWSGRMSSHDIQTRPHDKHFNSAASLYRPDNTSIFRGIQDVHHEGQSEPARQCNGTPCLQQLEMLRHILCEA